MSMEDSKGPAGLNAMQEKTSGGYTYPMEGRFAFLFGRSAINWGAYNPGFRAAGYYYRYPQFPYYRTTSKQAIRILKNEEKQLKDALKTIHARIDELEKDKTKGKNDSQKTIK